MIEDFARQYFIWLYDQVFETHKLGTAGSYSKLCGQMHEIPFKALVDHDENRVADGTQLRNEFLAKGVFPWDKNGIDLLMPDASIFEVLIALAKKADFQVDHGTPWWFMQFLENLQLSGYTDRRYRAVDAIPVSLKLKKFNERKYAENGRGGIFPLKVPNQDQRKVELWYQMAGYMAENTMY